MSLSRVLNHDQPLILRQVHCALEIRGQSVEISRNNRLGLPSYALLNAFRPKAVGILVNVGKDGRSTGKNNRVDRAHKSEGGENYLVARSDIRREESCVERRRPVDHGHRAALLAADVRPGDEVILRSEEHTSELQ